MLVNKTLMPNKYVFISLFERQLLYGESAKVIGGTQFNYAHYAIFRFLVGDPSYSILYLQTIIQYIL